MTEAKPPSSNAGEDVLQFLETLDTYSSQTTNTSNSAAGQADTQSVLDFLDQFSKTPTTTENAQNNSSKEDSQSSSTEQPKQSSPPPPTPQQSDGTKEQKQDGWSWGGLLASASTAYKTASTVVDTSVKGALATVETVRTNEGTKKFEEKFRGILNKEAIEKIGTDLRNFSLSTLTTVVNAVVPPISQYEIVEVWLTHDMVGYEGLESLVYRAFMKVMEQVEGGDIIVRKGDESKKYDSGDETRRELNFCEGFIEAVGIAKANIEQMIKKHYKPPPSINEKVEEQDQQELLRDIPTTTCPVFMAIQPTKANPYSLPTNNEITTDPEQHLFYVIVLTDPTHKLNFKTVSQALPVSWLDVPYEENEWVETKMVSTIKLAVKTIAQDYVWHRMTASEGHKQEQQTSEEKQE